MSIIDVNERIKLIDLFDLGMSERTGSFVILEDSITLIETSASPSIRYLKQGLKELNIELDQIKFIILTHIHLDHGGGVGLFLQDCPNAKVVVHPKAAKHLADPSKLEMGARAVYGNQFDQLFKPILPVPKERIMVKNDGETLQIGKNTCLTFYDTPGHARHHFSIYDPVSNGMFTGDTAGIYYWMLKELGIDLYLPTTSPNQFNPTEMLHSIKLYREKSLNYLYFGHFGYTKQVEFALNEVERWIEFFVDCGRKGYFYSEMDEERIEYTYIRLKEGIINELLKQQVPKDHKIFKVIDLDLKVCSMGLIDYWKKEVTNR
ncbi:MBL fold metallo-hydrolase [Heyndrickxia sp. FSL K6-6286]|uniref:MBL fold metallo-hydrolase n=1 Tax=Heyndrickxia sp. FSL K6-6286 TaxID=2921510 RepID=UPI00315A8354